MAQLRQGKQIPASDRWWQGCFRPGSQPVQVGTIQSSFGQSKMQEKAASCYIL